MTCHLFIVITGTFHFLDKFPELYRYTQVYTGIYRYIQVHGYIQVYTGIHYIRADLPHHTYNVRRITGDLCQIYRSLSWSVSNINVNTERNM